MTATPIQFNARMRQRHLRGTIFYVIALLAIAVGMLTLVMLFFDVLTDGLGRLDGDFISSYPSRRAERVARRNVTFSPRGGTRVIATPRS